MVGRPSGAFVDEKVPFFGSSLSPLVFVRVHPETLPCSFGLFGKPLSSESSLSLRASSILGKVVSQCQAQATTCARKQTFMNLAAGPRATASLLCRKSGRRQVCIFPRGAKAVRLQDSESTKASSIKLARRGNGSLQPLVSLRKDRLLECTPETMS